MEKATTIFLPFDLQRSVQANRDGVNEGLLANVHYRILSVMISSNQDRVQYLVQAGTPDTHTQSYWVNGAMIYQERLPERPDELTCTVKEATEWLKHLIKTQNVDEALRWVQIADSRQKAERRADRVTSAHKGPSMTISDQPYREV